MEQTQKTPTCETCYWFDDYVCTRLNCSVRLCDQVCWNYRNLALEVLKDDEIKN